MQYIYISHNPPIDPHHHGDDGFFSADVPIITADDRSFRFGDGIFETMLVVDGGVYNIGEHLARFSAGLEFFRVALDISHLEVDCNALLAKNNCMSGYVRIIVSRGNDAGAMGYLMGNKVQPFYVIQTIEKPFPDYHNIALWVSSVRAHIPTPCKINSAMHYTLSMLEARDHGYVNALILDTQDNICETASGNIFWVKDNVLYTPELALPFVPGTIRKKIIGMSAIPVREGRYGLAELVAADEIFMTNVGGLVTRVSSIPAIQYEAKNDDVTGKFRALIEADIKNSVSC